MSADFVSEALEERHDRSRFRSGQAQLDSWLVEHSLTSAARGTGRTFVWHRRDEVVVGYYTLAAHLLQRDELPRPMARGNPDRIPAVLLARLALDLSLHHRGLGSDLLADALRQIVRATEVVAARFVVVDAIDDHAAGFYQAHGFRAILSAPHAGDRRPTDLHARLAEPGIPRLIQKISDIAKASESA